MAAVLTNAAMVRTVRSVPVEKATSCRLTGSRVLTKMNVVLVNRAVHRFVLTSLVATHVGVDLVLF